MQQGFLITHEVSMANCLEGPNLLNFQFDTEQLSANQIRLIKTLNSLLSQVLTTEHESEFFDGSAECMRMCAALIKQAQFCTGRSPYDIPYADQVLEYSIDVLQEQMEASQIVTYDN